jgi:hypothetical protein
MRRSVAVAVLPLVVAAACAPSPPRTAAPRVDTVLEVEGGLRRFGSSFLREREGIREARFAGPPYLRGYARGRLAYPQIAAGEEDLDALLKDMIPSGFRRWSLRRLLGLSMRRSEKWIGQDHIEEIRGIADAEFPDPLPGGWSPFARQLSLHALHDFSQRFIDTVPLSGACTGFAAAGPATADGHVYLARNFDFEAGGRFDREKIVAAVVPESGLRYLSVTFGGMTGVVSGFNEKGLGVSLQSLSGGPTASSGEPSSLLVADVLQHDATLEQAIARIRAARVLVSDLYLVADGSGAMAVVEKTPKETGVRRGGPTLAATNLPGVAEISREVGATPGSSSSAARQERIDGLVARARGSIDAPGAVAILRNRLGIGDAPLGPGNRNAIDALIACHSVVFDLTARRAWVAAAPHTLGRFVSFDLELLSTAEPDDPRFAELAGRAIAADPYLASGYPAYLEARRENLRARRALAAGDSASAQRDASAALALAPEFVEALACRGEARLRLGDFAGAVEDFDASTRLQPGPPDFAAEIDRFRRAAGARTVPARPLAFPVALADTIESRE